MKWEDIVIIGALAVTFLNKQVANVSRPWCSYCSEAGETVFLLKKKKEVISFQAPEANPITTLVWGKSPTLPCKMRKEG